MYRQKELADIFAFAVIEEGGMLIPKVGFALSVFI